MSLEDIDFNDDPDEYEQFDEMESNASTLARRYAALCWWVDKEEVYQSAWVAQLDAATRYDGTCPFGAWVWRAALNAASRCVKKASAPVSASHRLNVLKGLMRASVTVQTEDGDEFERPELSALNTDRPEEAVRREQLRAKVRERVAQLVGAEGVEFAFVTYSNEFTTADIAEAHKVSKAHVTKLRGQVRAVLSNDDVLKELWNEL